MNKKIGDLVIVYDVDSIFIVKSAIESVVFATAIQAWFCQIETTYFMSL